MSGLVAPDKSPVRILINEVEPEPPAICQGPRPIGGLSVLDAAA